MKILIVGASGLVGSNCLKHFTESGHQVIGTHLSFATSETTFFDSLNPKHRDNFDIQSFAPDIIVHCGALTHVDYCEEHELESYQKTVKSTKNLIKIAKTCKARLVYISTDYVFDGKKGPYKEDAPTRPLNIYGKHKLSAEKMVLKQLPESLVLRITNVYGDEERGKNFISRIINQCKEKKHLELKLPYDQYASPTNAWDIARAMLLLIKDKHNGVFHIGGTDYMNRIDLAQRVLKYFPDATYTLTPSDTASLQQSALRPLMGGFIKSKFSNIYPEFLFSTVDEYVLQKSIE